MDGNALMVSFLFGMVGLGMVQYGRKAGRAVPLMAGVLLMAVPYFIPNVLAMLLVCCGLTALPLVLREA